MNSASAWFCARATFTSAPSAYWGLILRARRWRSLASARAAGAVHERHAAGLAEALARRVLRAAAGADERLGRSRSHASSSATSWTFAPSIR